MTKDEKEKKEPQSSALIGGALNIFGLKFDLGELLTSPENLKGRLEELREKLEAAGGKKVLSDEEWRQAGATITGHIRTRGILGDQEYHIGTMGRPAERGTRQPVTERPEVIEPPVDVFDEDQQVTIVVDIPGVSLDDLDLGVEGSVLSLSTRATAQRSYQKEIHFESDLDPDSLQSTCQNGVLQIRLRKRGTEKD